MVFRPEATASRPACSILLLVMLSVLGCNGSDDNGQGDAGAGGAAAMACRNLYTRLCERIVECEGDSDPSNDAQERGDCEAELNQELPCDRAQAVGEEFPDCMSDLKSVSCGGLFPGNDLDLPGSCLGVVEFAPTPGEVQCQMFASALCSRSIECTPGASPEDQEDCELLLSDSLGCFEATEPTTQGELCIQAVQTEPCMSLFPAGELQLPNACLNQVGQNGPDAAPPASNDAGANPATDAGGDTVASSPSLGASGPLKAGLLRLAR